MTMPASTRPRVVVLLAAVAMALLLLLLETLVAPAGAAAESESAAVDAPTGIDYTVRRGDTLWDIASDHVAPGDDVRVLVDEIRRHNDLGSSVIIPGQILLIPISGG